MNDNLSILFVGSIFSSIVVWLLAAVEAIAWWRLSAWSYGTGFLWVRRSIPTWKQPATFDRLELGTPPSALRCRRLDDGTLLLRSHISIADMFAQRDRYTVLPFKARVSWRDNAAQLEVRLPLGTTLFALCWLAGWTIGAMRTAQRDPSVGIGIWFSGFAILAGMFGWSFVTERKRLQNACDTLADHFGWPRARLRGPEDVRSEA